MKPQAMFGGPARDFVFTVTREDLQKMETPMLVLMGFLLEDIERIRPSV